MRREGQTEGGEGYNVCTVQSSARSLIANIQTNRQLGICAIQSATNYQTYNTKTCYEQHLEYTEWGNQPPLTNNTGCRVMHGRRSITGSGPECRGTLSYVDTGCCSLGCGLVNGLVGTRIPRRSRWCFVNTQVVHYIIPLSRGRLQYSLWCRWVQVCGCRS